MESVREILKSNETVNHPCGCMSLKEKMLNFHNCKIHSNENKNVSEKFIKEKYDENGRLIKSVITTEYDYNIKPELYLEEINASNLRLYTIIGIILG